MAGIPQGDYSILRNHESSSKQERHPNSFGNESVLSPFSGGLFSLLLQLHDLNIDTRLDLHKSEVSRQDVALVLNSSPAGGKNEAQLARRTERGFQLVRASRAACGNGIVRVSAFDLGRPMRP